jgi:hypothetical protein
MPDRDPTNPFSSQSGYFKYFSLGPLTLIAKPIR